MSGHSHPLSELTHRKQSLLNRIQTSLEELWSETTRYAGKPNCIKQNKRTDPASGQCVPLASMLNRGRK